MNRDEAVKIIKEYEGKRPHSLDIFLNFIGLTEEEFFNISVSHTVSPWKFDRSYFTECKKIHDFDIWNQHGKMPRSIAEKQLERWKRRYDRYN